MKDQIALITGANRGIGYAVAKGLLQKGITTIITSRNEKSGANALDQLSNYGNPEFLALDVTDKASISGAVKAVEKQFGKLDILINNAGINYDTYHNVISANLKDVHDTLETNLFGAWRMIQLFLPLIEKSKFGRIVNVSSGAGSLNSQTGGTPGYSLSKLALNGLTIQFANQLQQKGILVNSVCPGWVRTDMGGKGAPRSPEQGADTIIWASLFDTNGPTGKFFRDRREIKY